MNPDERAGTTVFSVWTIMALSRHQQPGRKYACGDFLEQEEHRCVQRLASIWAVHS